MAVSVLMSPTTPNVTNTNLVYTLSSSLSSNPQFRYVTDIYQSGSTNLLVRLTTYPNTYGTVNIDVSRELNDNLDWDNNWKTAVGVAPVNAVKTFNLKFGEEYGTSISSSTTIYTGSTANYLKVFPGHVYANQGSYNFASSSYTVLSNMPLTQSLDSGSYSTATIYNSNATVTYKQANGTTIASANYSNTGFLTIPIGSKNLNNYGNFDHIILSTTGSSYRYNVPTNCNTENLTRFAFINQFGFWDYYSVYNPLRRQSQVRRSTYDRPFVSYGNLQASYDITNRGTTQYYTQYNDVYEITTDYIDKPTADWLTELFESPDVYIQSGTDFIPVNILNTEVAWNLDQNRNKLFQYTISFKYANQREPR